MTASIVILIIALLFLVLAILFFCGKGSKLISGYNTMSAEEQQKYDEKKLCKAAGFVCLACSIMLFVMSYLGHKVDAGLMDENKMIPFVLVFIAVLVVAIIAAGVYISKKAKKS